MANYPFFVRSKRAGTWPCFRVFASVYFAGLESAVKEIVAEPADSVKGRQRLPKNRGGTKSDLSNV